MKRISNAQFGDLINASTKVGDEFDAQVAPVSAPIVAKALKRQKEEDEKALQDQICAVLDLVRLAREEQVQKIRSMRKMVDAAKRSMDQLDAAEAVAMKTGDFRQLLAMFGANINGYKGVALIVE